jgi:L-ascorbate metabolism protein UlaG (beta-lactamase superfamily)
MKKTLILLLLGLSSLVYAENSAGSEAVSLVQKPLAKNPSAIKLTYTICEGFVVQVADKKIMIDVLTARRFLQRQSVPDRVVQQMENALPPFDNVDIIFATHAHLDHFDPDLVVQHMEANTEVELVCPQQAAEIMRALGGLHRVRDRIHAVPYQPFEPVELKVKGIEIRCLPLSHNAVKEADREPPIQNLAYLIKYAGRTILHIGDNNLVATKKSYEQYQLQNESIDLAFLQALFWNEEQFQQRRDCVTNLIRPKHIVYMHLMHGQDLSDVSDEMKAVYPELTFFRHCLETRVFK